ncbi:hypothetical protein LIER_37461 [Lithospermum erythrorhizon]|uniref:Uncharacterized protein n=1 Tax=Lithospermum erythrorhizon TaxID=34254 RepID=A0AAV3PM53_LITER
MHKPPLYSVSRTTKGVWGRAIQKAWNLYLRWHSLPLSAMHSRIDNVDFPKGHVDTFWARPFDCPGSWQVCYLAHPHSLPIRYPSVVSLFLADSELNPSDAHKFSCNYILSSSACEKTRVDFLKDVFLTIGKFFRFAIASAVMVCDSLEWWSFELVILLPGLLPNPQLETSVLSICFTTIFIGIGGTSSKRLCLSLKLEKPCFTRATVFLLTSTTNPCLRSGDRSK